MDTASSKFQKLLEIIDGDIKRLDGVVRYSSIPVVVKELVSTHSYWVSLYSVLIHQILRPDDDKLIGAILLKAIVHDLPECITGDVVRTFKYSSEKIKNAIDEAEEKIIDQFPSSIKVLMRNTLSKISDGNEDYIKSIVKAADFMSLHQYMIREVRRGNREIMNPYYIRMLDDLHSMSKTTKESDNEEIRKLSSLYEEMVNVAKTVRNGG